MYHLWFIGYHGVDYCNISPLGVYFNTTVNICPMILWFVDASIHYTLIIKSFPKGIWCRIWFTLAKICVFCCSSIWQCGTHALRLTRSNLLLHMVSAFVFFLLLFFFLANFLCIQNTKYKSVETYTGQTVSAYDSSNTQFLSLRTTWFLMCRPPDPNPLIFSEFNSGESPNIKCCMVGSSCNWVLYFIFSRRWLLLYLQYEAPFFVGHKRQHKWNMCYTCIHFPGPTWRKILLFL